jgi:hypothetical protein
MDRSSSWPALPLDDWEPTYLTLHRWTQVIGKVRLALSPPVNHWWHASLRFHSHGLTTTPMPVDDGEVEIAFDFVDHVLVLSRTDGAERRIPLAPMSVAEFYDRVRRELGDLGVHVHIWPKPVEVVDRVAFPDDRSHASYEREPVARMWQILWHVHRILERFRSPFVGKVSPVQFFWGAFDVAVTRFSGRPNPHPPPDRVMREAYSHEVISHGFWLGGDWPGGGRVEEPIFYAYAVPEPQGFAQARVAPPAARYDPTLGEFVLPWEHVRRAAKPEDEALAFLQSTYEAGAELGGWDRDALERGAPPLRAAPAE